MSSWFKLEGEGTVTPPKDSSPEVIDEQDNVSAPEYTPLDETTTPVTPTPEEG